MSEEPQVVKDEHRKKQIVKQLERGRACAKPKISVTMTTVDLPRLKSRVVLLDMASRQKEL